ncbi:formamidopyrimidine-DNA glycosylase [Gorillibacterium timonense]|uniref:formamidopyrimidine-DNA glycosylase n=1 Tax=Gorillibacterium timonense TaxID=1689269 RepID=UPI00071D8A8F|nr:formamidopyrimidine-DNA glycosylase [Gorillibacterium timonense]
MLELPEAQTIARQLQETLPGRVVAHVKMNAHPHKFAFYHGDPDLYPDMLTSSPILQAEAHGGHVKLTVGPAQLVVSDGVNLRHGSRDERPPSKNQLYMEFNDGSWLTGSVQMYGFLRVTSDDLLDDPYYRTATEKPSPLTAAFDAAYFESLLREIKPSLSAKAFLATEQRIPGLGNGVLQDVLFRSGIHPRTPVRQLGASRLDNLYASVKETLRLMTDQGGRDTEKDLFGSQGGYMTLLSSKTYKDPCPECGGTIRKEAYLGGSVYSCVSCQALEPVGSTL